MTPGDFKAWMASQNLAKPGAARALGVSESTIADWMRGTSRTTGKAVTPDRRTALACSALAAGLDEWSPHQSHCIEEHTTQTMMMIIPPDVQFSALQLHRAPNGDVSFNWAPIERICRASNVPIEAFRDSPEDKVAVLLTLWYRAHLEAGGASNGVQEDLIAEAVAEEAASQPCSHAPGRA